ncbi:hypothetical protein SAMN05421827_11043 [Pedobacter terrae]|uniref:Uncharacterized protein n=1 Tax=Pedobacter terrae TaxID=405671 RepID=A0A1G7WNL7_9SPHI|nr:hypothetical protein [Pedobacter terrae]SDG72800.1 hypothetical protein SAMN05421827_11043 [Pedobacter terrae]
MAKEGVGTDPFIFPADAYDLFEIFNMLVCGIGIVFLHRMQVEVKTINKLVKNSFAVSFIQDVYLLN